MLGAGAVVGRLGSDIAARNGVKVDGGGGVGVVGNFLVGSFDGAGGGVDAAASEAWDARTLVDESGGGVGGENGGEPPPELLREVVGLVSSVSRSA